MDTAPDHLFDPSVPHPASVYAYWLGGKDHYLADRHAAEAVIRRRPQVVEGARANRAFLSRVIRFLAAECGIRQFLDIGIGLPAPNSTHQVAQAVAPECRPAAVLLLAVLHFITDTDGPAAIVATLAQQLAPGSFVVISHLTGDFAPGPVLAGVEAYNTLVPTTLVPRTHSQVSALFAGLPMVPPGVVPLTEWAACPRGAVPSVCRHVRRNRPLSDKPAKDNHLSHDHDSGAYAYAATIGAS